MSAWILIADSSRATLYSAAKALSPLDKLESFDHPASRQRDHEFITDRPRRSGNGTGGIDHREGPHFREAVQFARQLCDHLRQARQSQQFKKLYIAAAPGFLGLLRERLDGATAQTVAGAISKDLTQLDAHTVRRHLPEKL